MRDANHRLKVSLTRPCSRLGCDMCVEGKLRLFWSIFVDSNRNMSPKTAMEASQISTSCHGWKGKEVYQPCITHTRNPISHVDTLLMPDDDDPNIEEEGNGNFTESHALLSLSLFFALCELELYAAKKEIAYLLCLRGVRLSTVTRTTRCQWIDYQCSSIHDFLLNFTMFFRLFALFIFDFIQLFFSSLTR